MRLVKYRGLWCLYWREGGKPKRRSLRTADRAAAERIALDLDGERRQKAPADTVAQVVAAYLEDRKHRIAHPKAMELAWRTAEPFFGHYRPDQIDSALCRQFVQKRQKAGYSPGTIRKQLSILAAALMWKGTGGRVDLPSGAPPRLRRLSPAELDALKDGAASPHIKLFIILAATTAARAGALLDLTWDRVDLDRGYIDLGEGPSRTKGRALVPINESARRALSEAYSARTTDWVIEYGGEKVGSVKKGFARAAKRAGLAGVTPHVLRHTAAVLMAEAGVPMSEISQYMGHSSTRVTERVYARYSPGYLSRAAKALDVFT